MTEQERALLAESPSPDLEETTAAVAVEEKPAGEDQRGRKRGPGFLSSAGKAEKTSDRPKADPIAARLSRALRGKGTESSKEKEPVKESKASNNASKAGATTATRPKSNFKMKYIWGMALYLLIADFLGVWIQSWMKSQGLDAVVFTLGTFQASRSTLVFLALLVIILVLMARFDMIPRSFGAAMNGQSTQRAGSKTVAKTPTFESRDAQPTIKQGVKGANDELYREYRETQRYFQKRDRRR
ncbi:MAG TPA: hypothetical protein VF458_06105 [Ktedonobacteraceae bacterium]